MASSCLPTFLFLINPEVSPGEFFIYYLMNSKTSKFILILFLVIGIFYFFFRGLALAKGVLAPIFLAVILAMMLVPVALYLEKKGMKKGWAAFFSDLIFVVFVLGTLWAIGMEVQRLTQQWSSIEDRLSSQFSKVESFVEKNSGFTLQNPFTQGGSQQGGQTGSQGGNKQENSGNGSKQQLGNQQSSQQNQQQENKSGTLQQQGNQQAQQGGGNSGFSAKNWLTTLLSKIFSSLTTLLLITVYIFFMLLYRRKFWKAVLRFVPDEQKEKGRIILSQIVKQARQYLFGNMILVLSLTIVYSMGFSISGMKSPFTTAFLAAVLSLIPYVGTLLGGIIGVGVAFITTGKMSTVWIVVSTYVVAQFIESYFIEPYLVGKRVKVNPLFTILAVVIGGAVWGVIGMIVFLPLFSFIKAVADHVPMLNPVGYTIGNEDSGEGEGPGTKLAKKVKSWF